MKKYLLGLFILLISWPQLAQEYSINGTITGLSDGEVYLLKITGDNRRVIDTAQTDMTGAFEFILDEETDIGQYAVVAGPGQLVELLYNRENIRFTTTGSTQDSKVQIVESIENLIYYDYLEVKGTNLYKLDLLYPLLEYYPRNDEFYLETLAKVRLLQTEISQRSAELIENNPGTLSARVIRVDQPIFADPTLSESEQERYLKTHYFKDEDFLDTLLLSTNILTGKVISYLTLYQDQSMSQEELEAQLIIAVDTVLNRAFVDQQVYEFIVGFLIKGFEAIGFEKGLAHIATQNQLAELCVNSDRKNELENKMELIRRLAVGQPAPDFGFTDADGKTKSLGEIQAERTIVVFWASWCPHCEDMLPLLKPSYNPDNTEKLEVIAVSIDTDEAAWKAAIAEHDFNWINVAELKGWDSEIGNAYGLVATPTFFILDENKTIIGKPASERELKSFLSN